MSEDRKERKGNERPVSLHPMEFEEAVGALLEAPPRLKKAKERSSDRTKEAKSD